MQLLSYLIPGIILGLINYFLLGKKKGVLPLITSLLSFVFLFNIVILSIAKFLMNKPNILKATTYTFGFLIKYVLFALI
ncbi:MAG: LTA synthase family protein, partial [Clostridium sp.]